MGKVNQGLLVCALGALLSGCVQFTQMNDLSMTNTRDARFDKQSSYRASRMFAGPGEIEPTSFKAYGIVAFWAEGSRESQRYADVCEAYLNTLDPAVTAGKPTSQSKDMVTVWPLRTLPSAVAVRSLIQADSDSHVITSLVPQRQACESAVLNYDFSKSRDLVRLARDRGEDVSGRGPFLIAWSPPEQMLSGEAYLLFQDMSDVETVEDMQSAFRTWINKIEKEPRAWSDVSVFDELSRWRSNLKSFFDRNGKYLPIPEIGKE